MVVFGVGRKDSQEENVEVSANKNASEIQTRPIKVLASYLSNSVGSWLIFVAATSRSSLEVI